MKKILIAVTVLVLLAGGAAFYIIATEYDRRREAAWERIELIEAELKTLGDHPWAGKYSCGDGMGGESLYLAPDAGFVYVDSGDIHYHPFWGTCAFENDRIKLKYTSRNNKRFAMFDLPTEFVPIKWGQRLYMVWSGGFDNFCENIVEGNEPSHGDFCYGCRSYMLRDGDWQQPVEGLPEVPEEYRTYFSEIQPEQQPGT